MSSVLSEYPETLPAPMVGVVTPTERRKVGSIGGVQSFRTVQRDRHGARTYAFTFTKEQAAIFRDWWAEWEQRGGGWFAANWPLPWSRGPNVFRFKNPPEWSLIGGGIDGQGYWRASGSLEIRGRGMLPTVDVMYLTSTPYPLTPLEMASISDFTMLPGRMRWAEVKESDAAQISGFYFFDSTLRTIYHETLFMDSSEISNFLNVEGSLRGQFNSYAYSEAAAISDYTMPPGTLRSIYVQYRNWPADRVNMSNISFYYGALA